VMVSNSTNLNTEFKQCEISGIADHHCLNSALRFYASGSFQGVIADIFGLSQPSVSRALAMYSSPSMKQPKTSDMEHVCIGNNAILVSFNYTYFILKLVSYTTVERKILQIDEGGASKLKSGKLRNIMIVSMLNILLTNKISLNIL
jgi:hypothetical protein